MDTEQKLFEADAICFELQCAINVLGVIYDALEYAPNNAKAYTNALYFVFAYLENKQKALQQLLKRKEGIKTNECQGLPRQECHRQP